MQDINIFVQGEGRPTISLIQAKLEATIEELAAAAIAQGTHHAADGHKVSSLPHPLSHDTDARAELNEARHARVLKALSPGDVLATVDDLVSQILDARHHPLYDLVVHCLQHGGTKRSGKRPYMSEMVGASYEPLIDEAITRLVEEKLADFNMWED
jgi:hypothetical protein